MSYFTINPIYMRELVNSSAFNENEHVSFMSDRLQCRIMSGNVKLLYLNSIQIIFNPISALNLNKSFHLECREKE